MGVIIILTLFYVAQQVSRLSAGLSVLFCREVLAHGEQIVVQNGDGGHRFNDRHSAGEHTGVVTTASLKCGGLTIAVDGGLRAQEGGYGLESYTHDDVLAVGDASLNASAVVGSQL